MRLNSKPVKRNYYSFPFNTNLKEITELGGEIEKYERMGYEFIQIFSLNDGSARIFLLFKKTYSK